MPAIFLLASSGAAGETGVVDLLEEVRSGRGLSSGDAMTREAANGGMGRW